MARERQERDEAARLAELAAQALASEESAAPHWPAAERRAADIAILERTLRARHRRRWIRPMIGIATLGAAAALLAVVWRQAPIPGATPSAERALAPPVPTAASVEFADGRIEVAGVERQLAAGENIPLGTRLRVPANGHLALLLTGGTRLGLAGGAALRLVDLGNLDRFDLDAGKVSAEVAKLGPGRRFLIETPDAEVEVKGTRFEVEAALPPPSGCAARVRTRVTVSEGVVAVRSGSADLRLHAGDRWPDCSPPPSAEAGTRPKVQQAAGARHRSAHALARGTRVRAAQTASMPGLPPAYSSSLAEQNDLFAAALSAARNGLLDEARDLLDRLVTRYPQGQLADSARAERRRLDNLPARRPSGP